MNTRKHLQRAFAASAIMLATVGAANASTMIANFFEVSEATGAAGPDFGTCCSSPPATLPVIALGSGLLNGDPITTLAYSSGGVFDQTGAGQMLWWTPSAAITATGSGPLVLPTDGSTINMFAPNSMGNNNTNAFETAILFGQATGTGSDVQLALSSDDDAFVYINGKYIGGNPGVHGNETTNLDLGDLNGSESVEIFYADRAQTQADLGLGVTGGVLTAGVPEPATWAMFLVGFGAIGWTLRKARSKGAVATA
jgi:PEP-CTERM motif